MIFQIFMIYTLNLYSAVNYSSIKLEEKKFSRISKVLSEEKNAFSFKFKI